MIVWTSSFTRRDRRSGDPRTRNGAHLALITSRGTRSAMTPLIDRFPRVVLRSLCRTVIS
jgi:hypothetical protein